MPEWGHTVLINALKTLKTTLDNTQDDVNIKELAYIIAFYKRICVFSKNSEYFELLKYIEKKENLGLQFLINAKETNVNWQPPEEFLSYTEEHTTERPLSFTSPEPEHEQSHLSLPATAKEIHIKSYNVFPETKQGNQHWKQLKNTFRNDDKFNFTETPHNFTLTNKSTKEKVKVTRNTKEQSCKIVAKTPYPSSITEVAEIAHNITKITTSPVIVIKQGVAKDIIQLYKELDKFKEPRIKIKLSDHLIQSQLRPAEAGGLNIRLQSRF